MSQAFIASTDKAMEFDPDMPVFDSIFSQYERVIVESIITSFGLDFFIKDQHGGDVDTIHNVRQIGSDPEMEYKNSQNSQNYDNRGEYDSSAYHSHKDYIKKNKQSKVAKEQGELIDEYTGETVAGNAKINLDHVISAKEIHDDPGRVLAGLSGEDLANSPENLQITSEQTNKSKKADSMTTYIEKKGDKYTEEQKKLMQEKDQAAREAYEHKLFVAYYTSPAFAKDAACAAGKVGAQMALRQSIGFVFTEIWFSVKDEFAKLKSNFLLEDLFISIKAGIERGIKNAKDKYGELFAKLKDGFTSGLLSSLSTTLINIFSTTAKNVIKIIRQTWASVVEAIKILLFNPDGLPFGERLRAAAKVLAVGASIVTGSLVSEMVASLVKGIPFLADIAQGFCGALVTGIMSCTLLYFLDRSDAVQKIISFLNNLPTMTSIVESYRGQAVLLEEYAAKLFSLDIESFQRETSMYHNISMRLASASSDSETLQMLHSIYSEYRIKLPYKGDFDTFMSDRSNRLVFE